MGICNPKSRQEEDQLAASREIELELKKLRRDQEHKIKLLLLGTGDSGKSTFAKQLRAMHKGFTRGDYEKHRVRNSPNVAILNSGYSLHFAFRRICSLPNSKSILRGNCLSSMQKILNDLQQRSVALPKELAGNMEMVLDATVLDTTIAGTDWKLLCQFLDFRIVADVQELIVAFWNCKDVRAAAEEREDALQLPSSIKYFFKHAMRFASSDYLPTDEDIVHSRLRTTETTFTFEDVEFTIVDVGGQRSERRKWLHCFDAVTAVIYLAALDEYDRVLEEDSRTNRLTESLQLFGDVTGSQWFAHTSFILFLNKSDLFQEKIKKRPLIDFFPQIPRDKGSDFDFCVQFIQDLYEDAFKGSRLYPYVTCAIDTENCARVFHTVQDTIITTSLLQVGL